jgi:hypothetical protein
MDYFLPGILQKILFMKKLIIVLAVGMIATEAIAQNGKKNTTQPSSNVKEIPAAAPIEEVQFTPPKIVKDKPSSVNKVKFSPPVIVNAKGYAITIQNTKEEPIIILKKKGMVQKIRMSVWNAKPQYFENKYGQLPPPPPPTPQILPVPPAPPVQE